jgi:hypothetical protein
VWDRLNDPVYRNVLFGSRRQEIEGTVGGRTRTESAFICYHGSHGDRAARHVIVDWRPFERVVIRENLPMPGPATHELQAFELEETASGTRLRRSAGHLTGPAPYRAVARVFWRGIRRTATRQLSQFRDAVEASLEKPPSTQ